MTDEIRRLETIAADLRALVVRMVYLAGSGHIGGALSSADMVTALYFSALRVDPLRPDWPERDRFVLSKGHSCPVLYAALARRGFFPVEDLWTLRKLGSHLQGHPDMRKTPGIDATTGSLGQGFSVAVGMALAAQHDAAAHRVYALLGCGEMQEGQVWEAAMSAAHYRLGALTALIDYNGLQIDGSNSEIMEIAPLADKWRAFGWHVLEIDGHDMNEILAALHEAKTTHRKPTAIVARTIKGKGVSFMEDQVGWHAGAPDAQKAEQALAELELAGGTHA